MIHDLLLLLLNTIKSFNLLSNQLNIILSLTIVISLLLNLKWNFILILKLINLNLRLSVNYETHSDLSKLSKLLNLSKSSSLFQYSNPCFSFGLLSLYIGNPNSSFGQHFLVLIVEILGICQGSSDLGLKIVVSFVKNLPLVLLIT